jgi:hypothetical protein
MRRFFTFALLGPLIAGTLFVAVAFVRTVFDGVSLPPLALVLLSLMAMAVLQILPSLLAWGVDLAPFPFGLRILVCALAGMTGAGVIVANNRGYMGMFASGADIAAFVIASAISAVVCSWLSRGNPHETSSNQIAGE